MTSIFLTKEEVATLTGRSRKSQQVLQLRTMLIPFWINAHGQPVVPRSAIDGRPDAPTKPKKPEWVMPAIERQVKTRPTNRFGRPATAADDDSKES